MDIDKVLKDSSSKIMSSLAGEPVPSLGQRRQSKLLVGSLATAAVVIVVGSVVFVSGRDEGPPTADATTTSTTPEDVAPVVPPTTITQNPALWIPHLAEWRVQHPSTWSRVDNDLRDPATREPFDSMTLATFPIAIGDPTCPHIPTLALMDVGPTDALVSVTFSNLTASHIDEWPDPGYGDADLAIVADSSDLRTCSGRNDLEIHSSPTSAAGAVVTVAFGEDVTDELRSETWAVVTSLRPLWGADRALGGTCVVTVPLLPGLTPPDPWNPMPFGGVSAWFGTPDLWTPLDIAGEYAPRKSVWWSQHFTDSSAEPQPAIGVAYERLDEPADLILSGPPGTNASTTEDGLFMIGGIDPEIPGCWRVTATYKESSLSYVYHRPGTYEPQPTIPSTTVPLASPATGPLFREETGDVLVFDNGLSGVVAIDPDERVRSAAPVVGQRSGDQPYRMHRVDNRLVVGWGAIYAHSLVTGESTFLSVGTIFIPAVESGRIWIIDWANGSNIGTGVPSAWQVDMEGNILTEPTKIEADGWSFPSMGIPGGLAVRTDDSVVLWYPYTGFSDQVFGDSSTSVIDTWNELFAFCSDSCTDQTVINLSTGETIFTRTGAVSSYTGRFSPDGSMLALTTEAGDTLVIELANPDRVAGAMKGLGAGDSNLFVTWAPDSSALYIATYAYGLPSLTIVRYDIEAQTTATAVLPFGGTLDFVVMTPAEAGRFFSDPFDF